MTAYEHCLALIDQGQVAVCIPGTDQWGEPAVMVPELETLSPVGYMAAFHPKQHTRVGFIIGVTVGLGRYLQGEDDFTPAGHRESADA